MEVIRELMKKPRQTESLAILVFVFAVLYTVYRGTAYTILLGLGFTLIILGALPRQVALAFLVGASAILLVQTHMPVEGFATKEDEDEEGFASKHEDEDELEGFASKKDDEDELEGFASKKDDEDELEGFASKKDDEDELEGFASKKDDEDEVEGFASKKDDEDELEGFASKKDDEDEEGFVAKKKKVVVPDHTDRKEPLELGKGYKLPNENDDKGYHLDSGTTFLNAYKALKPDQIAAMTKDTQELLATQKALVGMLDSFGPLMKDMNKITGFFGPNQ
jgi:hypothetical protein